MVTPTPPTPASAPERPRATLGWRAALTALSLLPLGLMSRCAGTLARIPLPPLLRGPVLGLWARATGVRVEEAEHPLSAYPTVDAFFTRRLRPGLRSWERDPRVLASPVDGVVGEVGRITGGRLLQAKGRWYSAASLVADPDLAGAFEGGTFITLYLSPRHYHRVHTPTSGCVVTARRIPGRLFPVHAAATFEVDHLFARNERLVCTLAGPIGSVAVVAVGALNVGSISVAFDPEWAGPDGRGVTNRFKALPLVRRYLDPPRVDRGDELMAFHLGSTVVILTEPGARIEPGVTPGTEVTVGRTLMRRPRPQ
ncbi:MAG: archaetidylserine decarboxylase [Longimicrobiales bacterium]|nr:archaetidylserine decarboxylase [Longimicrobiales bacterium]